MSYNDIYDERRDKRAFYMHRFKKALNKYKLYVIVGTILVYFLWHLVFSQGTGYSKQMIDLKIQQELSGDNFKSIGKDLHLKNFINVGEATLREKLSYYFPYEPEKPIPRTVWQTWKCLPEDSGFPSAYKAPHRSWKLANPNSDVILIPDDHVEEFIETTFQDVPEVVATFKTLPANIMKADFFRYLVIFARGGTYSDLDTFCLKPIDSWVTFNPKYQSSAYSTGKPGSKKSPMSTPIGMTIGIEADPDRPDWADWYARRIQFCQWTIQGKSGHPLLRELIVRIVEETARKKQMNKLNKVEGKDRGGDIMQWTGPGIFTDTVFDYLNNVVTNGKSNDGYGIGSKYWLENKKYRNSKPDVDRKGIPLNSNRQKINWQTFTGMEDPLVIDDVMILPITSFSPGVGQMGSKDTKDPLAYVQHLFKGSWKPADERMS